MQMAMKAGRGRGPSLGLEGWVVSIFDVRCCEFWFVSFGWYLLGRVGWLVVVKGCFEGGEFGA